MNRAFSEAKLVGGKVKVKGPFECSGEEKVKLLRWAIVQGDVIVEGREHHAGPRTWDGETAAEGLQPGDAHGFAYAVLMTPGSPPRFEGFPWDEPVTLTP
jgi:hypothetical protein